MRPILFILVSILILFSCKRERDEPPAPKPYRLCLIDSTYMDGSFQKLVYDSFNRLTQVTLYNKGNIVLHKFTYEKDKITQTNFFENNLTGSFTALLNNAGYCDSLIINLNPGYVYEKYRYNTLNQYIEKITYYDIDSLKMIDTLLYEWKDGNLIYEISRSKISRIHYYDLSKENFFSDLQRAKYFLPSNKNLITKTKIGSQDSIVYEYKFDENNRIIFSRDIYDFGKVEMSYLWKCFY